MNIKQSTTYLTIKAIAHYFNRPISDSKRVWIIHRIMGILSDVLCLWSEYQNPCCSPRALAFTSPTDHSLPACSTLCAHHTNGKYALSVECTEVGKATKRKTKAKVRTIAACLLLCWLCRWFVGGVNDTSSTLHTIPLIAIRKRPSAVNVKTGALRSYTLSFKLPFAVV